MEKLYGKYTFLAIIIPSIVLISPIYIYLYILFGDGINLLEWKVLILFIGIFVFINFIIGEFIIRGLGRKLEKNIFKEGKELPTSLILSGKNKIFNDNKIKEIYKKIKTDYKKDISKNKENIELVNDIVEKIRYKVNEGRLLLGINSKYGMIRNILGFSLYSFIFSSILFFLYIEKHIFLIIYSIFSILFGILYIFRNNILNKMGFSYAKQLFIEYINYKDNK